MSNMVMFKKTGVGRNEFGAASILTVLIFSLLLSVIVIGLLRLSVVDSRSAIDDDLSNRAFFAAESGINEVAQLIGSGNLNFSDPNLGNCLPLGASAADPEISLGGANTDLAITCQIIDPTPGSVEAQVPDGGSFNVPLNFDGGATPSAAVVRWHIPSDIDGDGATVGIRGNDQLPDKTTWNNGNYPALMRVTMINRTAGDTVNINAINSESYFLLPTGSTESVSSDGQLVNALCSTTGLAEYACQAEIPIPATGVSTLKLEPLYRGSYVAVDAVDGSDFVGVQTSVDVTARAGDVFRRVRANVNVEGGATVNSSGLPSAALSSGETICKQITISSTLSDACSP